MFEMRMNYDEVESYGDASCSQIKSNVKNECQDTEEEKG